MSMIQYHSYIIAMNSFHSFLTFRNGDREMRGIVSGPLTFNNLTFENIDHGTIIPEYILYLIDKGTNRSGKHLGYNGVFAQVHERDEGPGQGPPCQPVL